MKEIFLIRREERAVALLAVVVIAVFQYLMIAKFFGLFATYTDGQWQVFMNNFHMSGFDPYTYSVVTHWHVGYNAIRHPLLPFLVLPLFGVNQLLWHLTGANCAQLVVGAVLAVCTFYSFVLLFRILHRLVGVGWSDALLLTGLFFGFAYILVATIVPDHFVPSLFLILLTLWRAGCKLRTGRQFSLAEALLLFVLTAGVTLSNGVIVGLAVWCVNGRKVFRWRFVLAFALVSLLLLAIGFAANALTDAPSNQQVATWIDTTTPRWPTLVENFFGESLQLHRQHVLGDVLSGRPLFVAYTWKVQYVVEAVLVLLFAAGLYVGRRSELLQLVAATFVFALLLHVVLGFAINEVYIMAAHWAFAIPIASAFLFRSVEGGKKWLLRCLVGAVTVYLWCYHGVLLYNYLTWPLRF